MSKTILVADVGIDSRSAGSSAVYTYRATPDVKLGEARFVPLGPRRVLGFVVGLREVAEDDLGFPVKQLKDLGHRVPEIDLPEQSVALLHEVARHYGTRTDRFKLIYYYQLDEWELFDLKEDPREKLNLFDVPEYASVRKKMLRLLEAERRYYKDDLAPPVFGLALKPAT